MTIRGVIFDFDGTLFDSMSIWENIAEDYLKKFNILEKNIDEKFETMSLQQAANYMKLNYNISKKSDEIISDINMMIEDYYFYHIMPKDNVKNFLSFLYNKGIRMCIVTATEYYQVESALIRCDMLKYFDKIFTCKEIGYSKDKPYIYEYACEYMNIPKMEIAVFEDALYAANTAKMSGFFVIGVYDKYEKQSQKLREITDNYIYNFLEAYKLFDI